MSTVEGHKTDQSGDFYNSQRRPDWNVWLWVCEAEQLQWHRKVNSGLCSPVPDGVLIRQLPDLELASGKVAFVLSYIWLMKQQEISKRTLSQSSSPTSPTKQPRFFRLNLIALSLVLCSPTSLAQKMLERLF
jgi:hypothetical protein